MKMTEEGLALIRQFEGFREAAYRDAVGVWTIGYGHTSMAGPPVVTPGLRISREQGADILACDVDLFARGVAAALSVPLNDAQFSSLVSFAYNVGLGNFRKSSVLRAVNAGDFAAVPKRLNLWVKAGGRTLPGLVKRRVAEGALFASTRTTAPDGHLPEKRAADARRSDAPLWTAWLSLLFRLVFQFCFSKKDVP